MITPTPNKFKFFHLLAKRLADRVKSDNLSHSDFLRIMADGFEVSPGHVYMATDYLFRPENHN